ncbi:MAG: ATPase [Gemmatimonadetes bacterium]|nr:SRPBCC domain-containing protein [Gemmatimonadota bacterium]NNF11766.1 ATPase [Gemmatimonadota bacterium]
MDSTLRDDGARYTLTVERRLSYPPAKVWRVLTQRDLLVQWFPCDIEGDWIARAPLRFHFFHGEDEDMPEEEQRGEVLTVDEGRLLEFRWGTHVLRYELEPDGDGCLLRLYETFDDPTWGARNAAGWEMCLDNLGLVLDGAAALKFVASVWRAKFERYRDEFEPEFGPQDDPTGKHPLLKDEAVAGDA